MSATHMSQPEIGFHDLIHLILKRKQLLHSLLKHILAFSSQNDVLCSLYHFDQLRDGHLKLHRDRIRHVLHWSDELVVPSE